LQGLEVQNEEDFVEESENGKFLGRPKRFENRHVMFEKEDPDGDITAVKFKADSTSTGCWDLGDPEPSQPSALRRARKMTVATATLILLL